MPWRTVSVMDQRREFVRLAMLEGANRRELCKRFRISHDTGYRWLARCLAGDEELADRSRRPHESPGRCSADIEAHVLAVRDAIRLGERARSRVVLNEKGSFLRRYRPCIKSCAGMAELVHRCGARVPISALRRKPRTCCGKWTSRAGCAWGLRRAVIR